ncbi:hypothetical protein RCO48_34540 [Peribacillus frigoritolerans]|nr:hypothetical protein [Peribacillus frigoritolerans]
MNRQSFLVDPYSSLDFKTVFGKGKVLMGVQNVKGSDERDPILAIKSVWKYDKGWQLVKAQVKPVKGSK